MDPPELWPALNVIEDLDTFTINLQEPPNLGGRVVVFVIFWDTRESKGTPWDPWALNTSKVEGTNKYRLVTTTPRRSASELLWKHQMANLTNMAENGTDV